MGEGASSGKALTLQSPSPFKFYPQLGLDGGGREERTTEVFQTSDNPFAFWKVPSRRPFQARGEAGT